MQNYLDQVQVYVWVVLKAFLFFFFPLFLFFFFLKAIKSTGREGAGPFAFLGDDSLRHKRRRRLFNATLMCRADGQKRQEGGLRCRPVFSHLSRTLF